MLDPADHRLIELLLEDGRATNRALAAEVGLTEATVAVRIRSLIASRTLGVSATFDWEAAGYRWSLHLPMTVTGPRKPSDVAEQVAALPGIASLAIVVGSVDLIAHALFPTRAHITTFLTDELGHVEGIGLAAPFLSLETVKYEERFGAVAPATRSIEFPDPVIELDGMDYAVLDALARDGRQSNREIARQLELSEATIRTRLRRLEESGLLRIRAHIDAFAAGTVAASAFVGVAVHPNELLGIAKQIAQLPDVLFVDVTMGSYDILLFIASPSWAQMVGTIADGIRGLPGVRSTETWEAVSIVRPELRFGRHI